MNEKNKYKSTFIQLSTQNKLIIFGWFLTSMLIFITAWLVISNTQKKIFDTYHNFGIMLVKTLAIESVNIENKTIFKSKGNSFSVGMTEKEKKQLLKKHAGLIIKSNNDIANVTFRNASGKILYSSKSEKSFGQKPSLIEIDAPIINEKNGKREITGAVRLGLTGQTMKEISQTTRDSMLIIFTIAWFISIFAVLINTRLITRQITTLADGVKRISTGEFGYKLASKDLWGEVKQLFEAFNDMSVRLRQYEEKNIDQLTYERNKLEAVLMSIANGVVVCDNYDKIVLINNASLKMLNVKAQEIVQTKIQDYYDINGKKAFQKDIGIFKDTPLEQLETKPFEFEVSIDDRIIQAIISPLFSITQEYQGYIIVLHDVTREKEIDEMKNSFISNVSHELRTPVTVIRSYIDTLHNYEGEFDENTKKEFLSIINHESDRLNRMVNEILDFSRLESPEIELEKTFSDIKPLLELTVSSIKVLAEQKNLSFSVIIEPDLPKMYMNAESIERALKNLLSNSIKYSKDGGRIKVRAELDRFGKNIEVSVEDNGEGIAEEHLNRLFDRFYRAENSTHAIKGTGLGLHLVKVAIEKHHQGEVFVKSKLGEGSTFGFRIPIVNQDTDWEITLEKSESS